MEVSIKKIIEQWPVRHLDAVIATLENSKQSGRSRECSFSLIPNKIYIPPLTIIAVQNESLIPFLEGPI